MTLYIINGIIDKSESAQTAHFLLTESLGGSVKVQKEVKNMTKVNAYEALFIVDMSKGEESCKAVVEKFKTLIADNAEVTAVNEWGKRRLAYPINDMNEGYYVLVNFSAKTDFPAELERVFGITEGIMRYMVTAIEA